jgi:hypothetical protein
MSYEGRGQYVHYKGGKYYALGVGEMESDRNTKFVVYVSYSQEHTAERAERGVDFVLRPLNAEDAERIGAGDAWNTAVGPDEQERFKLTAKFFNFGDISTVPKDTPYG